jgi:hypothetical protein
MVVNTLKNSTKKMKIFQVKYNVNHYCYYKAESRISIDEKTIMYKDYNDCMNGVNQIDSFESYKIAKSLLIYFQNQNNG